MRVQDVMTNRVHTVSLDIAAEDGWDRMRMRRTASAIVQRMSGRRIVQRMSDRRSVTRRTSQHHGFMYVKPRS